MIHHLLNHFLTLAGTVRSASYRRMIPRRCMRWSTWTNKSVWSAMKWGMSSRSSRSCRGWNILSWSICGEWFHPGLRWNPHYEAKCKYGSAGRKLLYCREKEMKFSGFKYSFGYFVGYAFWWLFGRVHFLMKSLSICLIFIRSSYLVNQNWNRFRREGFCMFENTCRML